MIELTSATQSRQLSSLCPFEARREFDLVCHRRFLILLAMQGVPRESSIIAKDLSYSVHMCVSLFGVVKICKTNHKKKPFRLPS